MCGYICNIFYEYYTVTNITLNEYGNYHQMDSAGNGMLNGYFYIHSGLKINAE